jgi:hypothetical protein
LTRHTERDIELCNVCYRCFPISFTGSTTCRRISSCTPNQPHCILRLDLHAHMLCAFTMRIIHYGRQKSSQRFNPVRAAR